MYDECPFSGFDIVIPFIATNDGKKLIMESCSFSRKGNENKEPTLKENFERYLGSMMAACSSSSPSSPWSQQPVIAFPVVPIGTVANKFWGWPLRHVAVATSKWMWGMFEDVICSYSPCLSSGAEGGKYPCKEEGGARRAFICRPYISKDWEKDIDYNIMNNAGDDGEKIAIVSIPDERQKEEHTEKMREFSRLCLPSLKNDGPFSPLFSNDGMHLNSLGYRVFAYQVCRCLISRRDLFC